STTCSARRWAGQCRRAAWSGPARASWRRRAWCSSSARGRGPAMPSRRAAGLVEPPGSEADADGDVLPDELEDEWFPAADPTERAGARDAVERAAARAASLDALRDAAERLLGAREGEASPGKTALYGGLRTSYAPPWELALQRWLEGVAAGVRSYERPSRRAVAQSDVVLAGRRREGWTLHIVLDTSGSMQDELSRALGAIGAFCDSVNVGAVRLLQCDCEVTRDDW